MKDVSHDIRSEFWDAMEDVTEGMLGFDDGHLIPMSPKVREDVNDGKIWFVSVKGNRLYEGAKDGGKPARLVVSERSEGIWADIQGVLSTVDDKTILEDVWSPFASAWLDDGKDDPDAVLLCFTPSVANVTLTDDSAITFIYQMAKAALTDSKPDLDGWSGEITL